MATIPMEILSTPSRPDIVVVKQKQVILLELTVPFNSPESMSKAKQHKESKELYQIALSDLEANGLDPLLLTLEIGALGHWLPSSRRALQQAFPSLSKSSATRLLDPAATKVISASRQLFKARLGISWGPRQPV